MIDRTNDPSYRLRRFNELEARNIAGLCTDAELAELDRLYKEFPREPVRSLWAVGIGDEVQHYYTVNAEMADSACGKQQRVKYFEVHHDWRRCAHCATWAKQGVHGMRAKLDKVEAFSAFDVLVNKKFSGTEYESDKVIGIVTRRGRKYYLLASGREETRVRADTPANRKAIDRYNELRESNREKCWEMEDAERELAALVVWKKAE